jgi:hypothetical protein
MAIALGVHASNAATSNSVLATPSRTSATSGSAFWGAQFTASVDTTRSVADSKSNVYTQIGSAVAGNAGSTTLRQYYKENGVGGSGHTFTSTSNQAIGPSVWWCEILGARLVGALHTSNAGQDSTSPYGDALNVTLTKNGLILALFLGSSETTGSVHAEGNGFTIIEDVTDGAAFWTGCLAYKIVGPGTYAPSFTETGAGNGPPFAVALAVFEEAPSQGRPVITGPGVGPDRMKQFFTRPGGYSAADVVVALTGQALTITQGTLTPATAKALTGNALTFSQGTLTPALSVPLSGLAVTLSQGLLTPAISATLSGQAAAFALGTLTPDTSIALSGLQATFSQGTLTAQVGGDVTVALSGQSLTFGQGALTPANTTALAGQALASASGALLASTSVALSGQQLSFAQGTLTAQVAGDVTVALTGLAMSMSLGTLSVGGSSPPSGGGGGAGGGGGGLIDWQRPRRKRTFRHVDEILDDVVAEVMYRELTHAPQVVREQAAAIVRPFTPVKSAQPAPQAVDWSKFETNAKRVRQLLKLWRDYRTELDDEDEWFLLS